MREAGGFDASEKEAIMATSSVEERLSALESEIDILKRQLASDRQPGNWVDAIAGSMDKWPEFDEVLRLGREFRESTRNEPDAAEGN